MENTNLGISKKIMNIFLKSFANEMTELSIIVSPRKDIYLFDQNKIREYYQILVEIALSIDNLDKGISFNEMCKLKNGSNWTKMRQHIEVLIALLDASNLIEYVSDEEKDICKIKLIERKVNKPKINKIS